MSLSCTHASQTLTVDINSQSIIVMTGSVRWQSQLEWVSTEARHLLLARG